tara:strand:+ start:643 stop:1569 length:927 start_codon:yes stop_codon:yes gene_type:complete
MRTVFMGNPEFAIPTIESIQKSRHELLAIVSNPPKPIGRGRLLKSTPVGQYAKDNKITLIEPDDLNGTEFKQQLINLDADLFVVVAYRILPKGILEIPTHGSINLHASLLPKYRGAAPIQWALMNGDISTGVTIFQIDKKMDTGDILFQKQIEILKDDNMLTLGNRLCKYGAGFIVDIINKIEKGSVQRIKQNQESVSFAPKINKKMLIINWNWDSKKIHNWVRGLSPYPGMYTLLNGKSMRIFKTFVKNSSICKPGEIVEVNQDCILVGTGKNLIGLLEIQLEGKKRLKVEEFIKGANIRVNQVLGG